MPRKDNSNTPVRPLLAVCDSDNDEQDDVAITEEKTKEINENIHPPLDDESNYLEVVRSMIREELNGEVVERLANKISKSVEMCIQATLRVSFEKLNNKINSLELKLQQVASNTHSDVQIQQAKDSSHPLNQDENTHQQKSTPLVKRLTSVGYSNAVKKSEKPGKSVHSPVTPATPIKTNRHMATDNSTTIEGDDWIEVRRRRSRISSSQVLRGVAKPGFTSLEASDRWKYFHLFYVKQGTTTDQVKNHINAICNTDNCTVEELKARGNYASFKLGVPFQMTECVLDANNWATDICVKPWMQFFRSRTEDKGKKETLKEDPPLLPKC